MCAWEWLWENERVKERMNERKNINWKENMGKIWKKNNKKKIINHSKTSFYWETDFNEEKNEREKIKQNGVFHFKFKRFLAGTFISSRSSLGACIIIFVFKDTTIY